MEHRRDINLRIKNRHGTERARRFWLLGGPSTLGLERLPEHTTTKVARQAGTGQDWPGLAAKAEWEQTQATVVPEAAPMSPPAQCWHTGTAVSPN